MGTLYLVRHGQASFGADNYDQLSPNWGTEAKSERLGEYFAHRGLRFDAAFTGTLQPPNAQTLAGICKGGAGIALAGFAAAGLE
jgi:broad specificity phosphatase PhoE